MPAFASAAPKGQLPVRRKRQRRHAEHKADQLPILERRDAVFRRHLLSRADLLDFDIEIRDQYFEFAERARNPTSPILANTDGEPLELTTLRYAVACPLTEALDRLLPLARLRRDEHVDEIVRDDGGAITRAVLRWVKAGNKKNNVMENTILGRLELEDGRLVVEVNSAKRAKRISREIVKRLGDAASLESRATIDQQEMWESARRQQADESEAQDVGERSPELAALEDELFVEHVKAWIDTPVPALGDRTPRQASRSRRGRERLEALVAGFVQQELTGRKVRQQALADLRRRLRLGTDE